MNLFKTLLATALTVPLALTGCGGSSDGHNSGSGQQYQFSGAVQKGPLQPGAVVTIKELDRSLQPTGRSYTTQIEDYVGNYSVNERFSSKYAELEAEGYYFNELTNTTDKQMRMSAFVDMSEISAANFNVATAAMKQSVMAQVEAGTEFNEAVDKATSDLLKLYSYAPEQWSDEINFYNTNLSNSGDTSTLLLVISTSTLKMATDNKLTLEEQIDEMGQVLLEPESVKFEEMKQALNTYNLALYKTDAYENTQNYFVDNGLEFDIPHIDYFIDVDGDGVLPSKDLPVFKYTAGISVDVSKDSIGSVYPVGASAVDYQGRPMTFEYTDKFKYGEIVSVEQREDGIGFEYRLTDVNFEGNVDDCVTVNTITPSPANFSYNTCVTLSK